MARRFVTLLLELLTSDDALPELAVGAIWYTICDCLTGATELCVYATESLGIIEVRNDHLSSFIFLLQQKIAQECE